MENMKTKRLLPTTPIQLWDPPLAGQKKRFRFSVILIPLMHSQTPPLPPPPPKGSFGTLLLGVGFVSQPEKSPLPPWFRGLSALPLDTHAPLREQSAVAALPKGSQARLHSPAVGACIISKASRFGRPHQQTASEAGCRAFPKCVPWCGGRCVQGPRVLQEVQVDVRGSARADSQEISADASLWDFGVCRVVPQWCGTVEYGTVWYGHRAGGISLGFITLCSV